MTSMSNKAIQAAAPIVREFLYEAEEIAHLRLRERTSALDDWANRITNAAIEAAAPLLKAEVEREVVEWLKHTHFGDDELDAASVIFAERLQRGDHRIGEQHVER